MSYRSYNPYTQELKKEYPYISDNDLNLAVEKSARVFNNWKKTAIETRTKLLGNLADILDNEAEEHAAVMTAEMGKPIRQAVAEVKKCALACRYYRDETARILSPVLIKTLSSSSKIIYQPQGIVFAIMPWNFPYWQVVRCLAPAVASGNSVILKHASNVPGSASMLEDAVIRAGFPQGLFQKLFLTHKQTAELIANRNIRTVSLTGSNIAGEIIASIAGEHTKKCVLELGGSDPFIVFGDADIEKAAEAAVTGRFQNNGQSCIATKRIFLHVSVYNEFMELFLSKVKKLRLGNPMDPGTDIGPLVDPGAVKELKRQVRESVEMGAKITMGQLDSSYGDAFMEPIVIENVPDNAAVAVEETFGPVVPVFSFENYDEMIRGVNASIFGLGSSVWTKDKDLVDRLSADIDAGTVSVNGFTRSDPMLPFGGVKSSGYGRELSDNGMLEFLNIKTISIFE